MNMSTQEVTAYLEINAGECNLKHIELKGEQVSLGRNEYRDVVIIDPRISRKHCIFIYLDNKWFIQGTAKHPIFVEKNNKCVKVSTIHGAELIDGDVVHLLHHDVLSYTFHEMKHETNSEDKSEAPATQTEINKTYSIQAEPGPLTSDDEDVVVENASHIPDPRTNIRMDVPNNAPVQEGLIHNTVEAEIRERLRKEMQKQEDELISAGNIRELELQKQLVAANVNLIAVQNQLISSNANQLNSAKIHNIQQEIRTASARLDELNVKLEKYIVAARNKAQVGNTPDTLTQQQLQSLLQHSECYICNHPFVDVSTSSPVFPDRDQL